MKVKQMMGSNILVKVLEQGMELKAKHGIVAVKRGSLLNVWRGRVRAVSTDPECPATGSEIYFIGDYEAVQVDGCDIVPLKDVIGVIE